MNCAMCNHTAEYKFRLDRRVCMPHYENMPMQHTEIFLAVKIENFQLKNFGICLIFAQNIDCGYPQSIFWSKNKKNTYTPAFPSFAI